MKRENIKVGDLIKLGDEQWDKGYKVVKVDTSTIWLVDKDNGTEYPYSQPDGWLIYKNGKFVNIVRKKKVKVKPTYRRIIL